ncbi:BlaI/MecI/CopY family transcriptional regulator [Asticcacaulis sp. AND118]|uniref:BlaI/MecI/CopY family transcriptional regulator n=1 Tax=Asticcacaulis sp. AND118 TaxID=2840468 RepID=UPI001CFF7AFB|nr:BlaI/MecI/CopY family transcriptional regulator [Asticcacaulis sp. AND118]UDF05130.1 BlaI/MecI/CopY family transcriptional regulator [Asticcacaulis sp. AND118]
MSLPPITDAESAVLDALWRLGPLPPARLIAEVKTGRDWGDATIKTLIARLIHKQALRSQREDGTLRYHPLITRDAYVAHEIDNLINRTFASDRKAFRRFIDETF